MLNVLLDRRSIIKQLLLPVFEFFVVAKELCVLSMEILITNRDFTGFQIEVGEEKRMKSHLAELEAANRFIPR